jgi:hypothetical protein
VYIGKQVRTIRMNLKPPSSLQKSNDIYTSKYGPSDLLAFLAKVGIETKPRAGQ